jgi:RNA polymerase sigma-70 factor (ECF subfamily)
MTIDDRDREELLRQAVRGDRQAVSALLEQCGAEIRGRIARRIPRRWQAVLSADDVLQQTYADAIRDLPRFDCAREGDFGNWLLRLARCNLADGLKMLKAAKRGGGQQPVEWVDPECSALSLLDHLSGDGDSPSLTVARGEAREFLRGALDRLPPTYREVIRLYDLEERGVEEVATAMGRSPGAVFMLRARAHDRLRQVMGRASRFLSG